MSTNGLDPQPRQMQAVTLSRQYGSGGGEIAARLAGQLHWQLIDHQIVAGIARQLGISEAEASNRDEHEGNLVSRVINALLVPTPEVPIAPDDLPGDPTALYHKAVSHLISESVGTGQVVIVGRGAQAMLQARRDVLHVRVVAPLPRRIEYVMLREGLNEGQARSRIQHRERDRRRYLQVHYHRDPDDSLLYDLVLNTGVIDLESAVDLILMALERKGRRLQVPDRELGPAAGLPRYRSQPKDVGPHVGSGGSPSVER
jgi:cytidylate kinase